MGSSLPPTGTPSRERAIVVATLAAFALAYLGLALAWRADAAKAAPRVASARVDGKRTAAKDYAERRAMDERQAIKTLLRVA